MRTVLVVEDESSIAMVLSAYLKRAGYKVELAVDGPQGKDAFDRVSPDIVVLDVMLPGCDGWEVLTHIRRSSSCPVVMLTALGATEYKLSGFEQGADDYVTKPFESEEVVARVNAILRRASKVLDEGDTVQFGALKMDFKGHAVYLNGARVDLTPRDLSLLLYLARRPNQTFTRDQLLENVWGMDYDGSDRAVDLAVKRIRKSLENWPVSQGEIRTLRGTGYQLFIAKE